MKQVKLSHSLKLKEAQLEEAVAGRVNGEN
jgi:hypothetical protein